MAQGLVEKILNVKKHEWRLLSWLLLFFFFESIGTEIMDILAVSTFLKEAGIKNLPLVYVIDEALLAFFLVLYGTVVDRFDRARFVNFLQIAFASSLTLLFVAIKMGASASVISVLIYVLKSLIISVLEEAFWLMNDDLFDVQEAKRLYPIINLGGVAGGMIGGALVAALLTTFVEDTNNLIPIAPIMLAAGIVFIHLARRRALKEGRIEGSEEAERLAAVGGVAGAGDMGVVPGVSGPGEANGAGGAGMAGRARTTAPKKKKKKKKKVPLSEGIRFIRETPLFKYILIIFVIMGTVAPLGDWMFAAAADSVFVDKKSYATFLSIYKTSLTIVIFFAQLFFSGKILTRMGLTRSGLISPVNNIFKFIVLGVWFKLGPVIYSQGTKKLLEKVVTKPAQRVFFGFAPRANKGRIKIFIKNMKGNSAIVTLLLLFAALHLLPIDLDLPSQRMMVAKVLAVLCAALSVAWLVAAWRLKTQFTASLMDILQKEEIDFSALERVDFRSFIDHKAVKFLLANLERGDDKRSIFISGILEEIADERVLDPVLRVFPSKSVTVRISLVQLVGRIGGSRAHGALSGWLGSDEPQIRAAAISALGELPETDAIDLIVPFLQDPDEDVQSAAAGVVLKSKNMELRRKGLDVLEGMLRSPDRNARVKGIFLLGELGVKRNTRLLEGTIRDTDADVRFASMEALLKLVGPRDSDRFIPQMETLLKDPEARIRHIAAQVVRAIGGEASVAPLSGCLTQRGYATRRVSVEGLAQQGELGRKTLVQRIGDPRIDLETKELALLQLRKSGWGTEQMRENLLPLADNLLKEVFLRALTSQALKRLGETTEPVLLLLKTLADQDEEAKSLSIAIITSMANPEKIKLIQKALASGTRQTRANVLELLENASEKNLFRLLLPLLDGISAADRIALARRNWQARDPEPIAALRSCTRSGHLTVRLAAIYAAGELKIGQLAEELRALAADPTEEPATREEAERALRAMS